MCDAHLELQLSFGKKKEEDEPDAQNGDFMKRNSICFFFFLCFVVRFSGTVFPVDRRTANMSDGYSEMCVAK